MERPNSHYGPNFKLVTNERINNPNLTLQQIGDKFGLSRERVRRILKKANLHTVHAKPQYICKNCGEVIKTTRNKHFCNFHCYREYSNQPLTCNQCGKIFLRRSSEIKAELRRPLGGKGEKLWFCSKKCNGIWLGKTYGFNGSKREKNILQYRPEVS